MDGSSERCLSRQGASRLRRGRARARVSVLAATLVSVACLALPTALAETFEVVQGQSTASYTAHEELVRIGFNEVVGTTPGVTGRIVLDPDGAVAEGSQIVVDVTELTTDERRRDNFLRRASLETDAHPTVTFVPTSFVGLPWPLPTEGSVDFQIVGDLTVRDVTRPTTWQATATADGETVRLQAATTITFDQFDMRQPRVMMVISVEQELRLAVDLTLEATADGP